MCYNYVMKYLAVLGRQPRISAAELETLYKEVKSFRDAPLAEFTTETVPDIRRLGGTMKIAKEIALKDLVFPDGKITLGISDYSPRATAFGAQKEALRLKRQLVKAGRSVRVVANKAATLSLATSLHNGLFTEKKTEIIKYGRRYFQVLQLSNIESYARRDRERPARDAKVGMLPPKLAQILINLCGVLPEGARVLDPFCGTGVVLQEALLMGYTAYGTDLQERMVDYSRRNLEWLGKDGFTLEQGDATNHTWQMPVNAVACECFLGSPMSQPPAEIKLKSEKMECKRIILGFLRNLAEQIHSETPVVLAIPAWLRPNGSYERLNLLDEIRELRYNVYSFKNLGQNDLLYHRAGQVVAREIIVLRKK